jgi:hypothetical protein
MYLVPYQLYILFSVNRTSLSMYAVWRVWRYQKGIQNPYIEEEQTTQNNVQYVIHICLLVLYLMTHFLFHRHCMSLPFRSTCVHPTFLVRFVLLDLYFYMYVLLIVVCASVLFLLAIVLSVLLRFTDSDYPFGICKLFFIIMMSVLLLFPLICC